MNLHTLPQKTSTTHMTIKLIIFAGPPDPPAGVPSVCCYSPGTSTINWGSSPYDGGCTVTGYTVEMNRAGENTWTTIAESCHSLSHTVPAPGTDTVLPGERYRFRVRAENIHGVSEPGSESEFVRIPKEGETLLHGDEEGNKRNCFSLWKVGDKVVTKEILFGQNSSLLSKPESSKWRTDSCLVTGTMSSKSWAKADMAPSEGPPRSRRGLVSPLSLWGLSRVRIRNRYGRRLGLWICWDTRSFFFWRLHSRALGRSLWWLNSEYLINKNNDNIYYTHNRNY